MSGLGAAVETPRDLVLPALERPALGRCPLLEQSADLKTFADVYGGVSPEVSRDALAVLADALTGALGGTLSDTSGSTSLNPGGTDL